MLLVSETFVNETEGYRFGETEPYEPYTDNIGRLFRDMQKEYGRCTGAVYVDRPNGAARKIGWVFQKNMTYEGARDPRETYTREVWVTLHDAPDTVERTTHYHTL